MLLSMRGILILHILAHWKTLALRLQFDVYYLHNIYIYIYIYIYINRMRIFVIFQMTHEAIITAVHNNIEVSI